ncbi:hypothetical protein JOF56_010477 [Kibdelosporangium banguiense]|uniref:Uncharacterized protein n=1 Tax=Kibdelosporangium banguiense TaxID=1365924 RepID=A0ABS4U0A8_9PSEU|nr:hypothetical protein [Kibdelosporangium banguiense]
MSASRARPAAVVTTAASITIASVAHPLLGYVLAAVVLCLVVTAAVVIVPAAWSRKKYRRDAALAVLDRLLGCVRFRVAGSCLGAEVDLERAPADSVARETERGDSSCDLASISRSSTSRPAR